MAQAGSVRPTSDCAQADQLNPTTAYLRKEMFLLVHELVFAQIVLRFIKVLAKAGPASRRAENVYCLIIMPVGAEGAVHTYATELN